MREFGEPVPPMPNIARRVSDVIGMVAMPDAARRVSDVAMGLMPEVATTFGDLAMGARTDTMSNIATTVRDVVGMGTMPDVATTFGDMAMGARTDVAARLSDVIGLVAMPGSMPDVARRLNDVVDIFGDLTMKGMPHLVASEPSLLDAYCPVAWEDTVPTSTPSTSPRLETLSEAWQNLSRTEQLAVAWAALLLTLLPYTVQAALRPGSKYNPLGALAESAQEVGVAVVAGLIILLVQQRRD